MLTVTQPIGPKTVIITATPSRLRQNFCDSAAAITLSSHKYLKRPSSISPPLSMTSSSLASPPTSSSCGEDFVEDIGDFDFIDHFMPPPRKRERLTHLTPEEKNFRRKMKNRIAAQTARDRKKSFMIDLEDRIKRLQAENDALKNENGKLLKNAHSLSEENSLLKTDSVANVQNSSFIPVSAGSSSLPVSEPVKREITNEQNDHVTTGHESETDGLVVVGGASAVAVGSAASINDLQQKGQTTAVAPPPTSAILDVLLLIILAATMNSCSSTFANSSKANSQTNSSKVIRLKLKNETEQKKTVSIVSKNSNDREMLSSQKLNALLQLYKAMRWKTATTKAEL